MSPDVSIDFEITQNLSLWDYDSVSRDDHLGSITIEAGEQGRASRAAGEPRRSRARSITSSTASIERKPSCQTSSIPIACSAAWNWQASYLLGLAPSCSATAAMSRRAASTRR